MIGAAPEKHARHAALLEGGRLFAKGDLQGAIDIFRSVLSEEPRNVVALNNLGAVYWHVGRPSEACECFRRAVEIDSNYRQAVLNYAKVTEELGDRRLAREILGKFYVLHPLDDEIWIDLVRSQRIEHCVKIDEPLLLISQIQRSGGTLLSQLFDGHPQCFAHPFELHWGRPEKWYWPQPSVGDVDPEKVFLDIFEHVSTKFVAFGYAKDNERRYLYPFLFDVGLQREIFVRSLRSVSVRSRRQVLDAYMTSYFNAWLDYQNLYRGDKKYVTAFVARLNMNFPSCEEFFADYPDGVFVSVIRHPGDWYASARRHKVQGRAVAEYQGVESAMALWCSSTRASIELKKRHPDQVVLVSFESLVGETKGTMSAIAAQVGLDWDDTLLVPTFNSMPAYPNSSFGAGQAGVMREAVGRHRKELSEEERRLVDDAAGDLYEEALSLAIEP